MKLKQDFLKKENKTEFADVNFWMGQNFTSSRYSIDEKKAIDIISSAHLEKNIKTFFISSFLSASYSPIKGNEITAGFLNDNETKADIFGVLFLEQENFSRPLAFKDNIIKRYGQGFRLLRLLPKSHKYPYEAKLLSGFYEVLDRMRFPVILSLDEIDITGNKSIEWNSIYEICNRYENMPFIIDGGESKELMYNSYLLSLLYSTLNVFIETHNLLGFNQIEDLANFAGSKRIIFGSYYPFMEQNISLSRLLNAGISQDEKQDIAAANILKLVNNINTAV
ncbi:MAG: amidohydrolase family protein [Actinobacteria bacterium]|nr:amidohydrolase family protein [Actinomycetota bacterium]